MIVFTLKFKHIPLIEVHGYLKTHIQINMVRYETILWFTLLRGID